MESGKSKSLESRVIISKSEIRKLNDSFITNEDGWVVVSIDTMENLGVKVNRFSLIEADRERRELRRRESTNIRKIATFGLRPFLSNEEKEIMKNSGIAELKFWAKPRNDNDKTTIMQNEMMIHVAPKARDLIKSAKVIVSRFELIVWSQDLTSVMISRKFIKQMSRPYSDDYWFNSFSPRTKNYIYSLMNRVGVSLDHMGLIYRSKIPKGQAIIINYPSKDELSYIRSDKDLKRERVKAWLEDNF
nr:TPA_asm: 22 kDa protein [Citrullus ophiovirus]